MVRVRRPETRPRRIEASHAGRGDDEFVEFARAVSARLFHAAYLMTGDHHQAEDAAQTALVLTYAAWSGIRRTDPYGYTRTILINHLTDRWRRPTREYTTEELPDHQEPGDIADEVSNRRWLLAILSALTARERAVLVLRHYFDLGEADVARELDVSIGTVKSTCSRALEKLRTQNGSAIDSVLCATRRPTSAGNTAAIRDRKQR